MEEGLAVSNLVYFADNDMLVRHLLQTYLEKEGYTTQGFETGDELFAAFDTTPCDIIISEVTLPGTGGLEIAAKIKKMATVPIIILTLQDSDSDHVRGIEHGADVYLTKPLRPAVLIAYVKMLLQRTKLQPSPLTAETPLLKCSDITINPGSLQVFCNNRELALTKTEFSLLSYLVENQKASVSREELLRKIWNYGSLVETRAADDVVKRLRRKLSDAGSQLVIETIWGHGFKLKI